MFPSSGNLVNSRLSNDHHWLRTEPKHLLWTLYFLKVYPREGPGCAAVGGSRGAVDPKTMRKWVWLFLERIAELADEVVSSLLYCVLPGIATNIIFCHCLPREIADCV